MRFGQQKQRPTANNRGNLNTGGMGTLPENEEAGAVYTAEKNSLVEHSKASTEKIQNRRTMPGSVEVFLYPRMGNMESIV